MTTNVVDMFPHTAGTVDRFLATTDIYLIVSGHVESIVLLSILKSNKLKHVNVELEMDELDLTAAESKETFEEIKDYVPKAD